MTLLVVLPSLHFAAAFEDSTLIDGQDWGGQGSKHLAGRMNFHAGFGINVSFHPAIDDECLEADLPFDIRCLTDDQRSAVEDLPLEFSVQTKYALECHLSLKNGLFPQISADFLGGR